MPRKSAASTSAAPASPTTAQVGDTSIISSATEPKSPTAAKSRKQQDDTLGVDDLLLPRSLTSRIARGILPANTSIQKDAILALTKSATVFISYLASHANELTSKKTISPQDVLNAVREIEMDTVMDLGKVGSDGRRGGRLERELEMYEESVRGKRKGYREKVKARETGVSEIEGEGEGDDRGEPERKRVKRVEDDEEDDGHDDDDLLDAQLNGPHSHPFASGGGRVNQTDGPAEDNDETEDDPEIEDELDDGEDAADEEDDDDDDELEREGNDEDEDRIDVDEGDRRKRAVLVPNGRVEVGSDDESD